MELLLDNPGDGNGWTMATGGDKVVYDENRDVEKLVSGSADDKRSLAGIRSIRYWTCSGCGAVWVPHDHGREEHGEDGLFSLSEGVLCALTGAGAMLVTILLCMLAVQ